MRSAFIVIPLFIVFICVLIFFLNVCYFILAGQHFVPLSKK